MALRLSDELTEEFRFTRSHEWIGTLEPKSTKK